MQENKENTTGLEVKDNSQDIEKNKKWYKQPHIIIALSIIISSGMISFYIKYMANKLETAIFFLNGK